MVLKKELLESISTETFDLSFIPLSNHIKFRFLDCLLGNGVLTLGLQISKKWLDDSSLPFLPSLF